MFNPNNPLPAAFLPPTPWNFVCGCVLWLVEVRAGVDKEDSQDEIKKAGSWKEHLPAWKTVTLKLSFTPKSMQGFHDFLFSKSSIHQNTTPGYDYPMPGNAHISPSPPDMWLDHPGQRARPESCRLFTAVCVAADFFHWLPASSSLAFATGVNHPPGWHVVSQEISGRKRSRNLRRRF